MAQIIQYIDTPLVPGEEYQLTFNADITSGILVVKQGTTVIYSSNTLYFGTVGGVFDNINVIDYVYMNRVTRTEEYDEITVSESVQFEIVSYVNTYSDSAVSENFSATIINYVG